MNHICPFMNISSYKMLALAFLVANQDGIRVYRVTGSPQNLIRDEGQNYSETRHRDKICIEPRDIRHRIQTYETQYTHSSQTAAFALSSSSFLFASSSLSRFRRRSSCSFIARSYARCSSVLFGARIPNAPAISLPATAVCFSGLLVGDLDPDPRGGDELNPRPGKGALDPQS